MPFFSCHFLLSFLVPVCVWEVGGGGWDGCIAVLHLATHSFYDASTKTRGSATVPAAVWYCSLHSENTGVMWCSFVKGVPNPSQTINSTSSFAIGTALLWLPVMCTHASMLGFQIIDPSSAHTGSSSNRTESGNPIRLEVQWVERTHEMSAGDSRRAYSAGYQSVHAHSASVLRAFSSLRATARGGAWGYRMPSSP